MAETWQLRSAWAGHLPPAGRHGRGEGAAGMTIVPREGLSLCTVVAVGRNGSADGIERGSPLPLGEGPGEGRGLSGYGTPLTPTLSPWDRERVEGDPLRAEDDPSESATILAAWLGLATPAPRRASLAPDRGLVWSGPGQWLAFAQGRDALTGLAAALAGRAAVTDQGDARAILRVSGPRARDALAKGFSIDLHPRAFPAGGAATTVVAHVGAQIWMIDEAPTYEIAVGRSFAGSFWRWLAGAADAFGYDVEEAGSGLR